MAGGGKDIDPATELADDDEEQALPERDELSLEGASGSLGAGHAGSSLRSLGANCDMVK